jgi:hypothetical protein
METTKTVLTAIRAAAQYGLNDLLKYLISKGNPPEYICSRGKTAPCFKQLLGTGKLKQLKYFFS